MQFFMIKYAKKRTYMQLLEFKELLKKANMNKKDFSQITKVSYGTVNSWGVEGRAEVPEWVRPFLNNYIEVKKLEKIKSILLENEDQ
jgi:collagenase-like PrtC family protease